MEKLIEQKKFVEFLRTIMQCWNISPYLSKEKREGATDMFLQAVKISDELPDKSIDFTKQIYTIKKKLELAEHCIAEISDRFDRGKCSNDYVEAILKEYYKNEEHN